MEAVEDLNLPRFSAEFRGFTPLPPASLTVNLLKMFIGWAQRRDMMMFAMKGTPAIPRDETHPGRAPEIRARFKNLSPQSESMNGRFTGDK